MSAKRITRGASLVATAVCVSLLASACGGTSQAVRAAADADPVVISALPSESPAANLQAGGGGLQGAPYAVPGMPGALGPSDNGIDVRYSQLVAVGGTRVKLTAKPGSSSYRFVVAEAGEKADGPTKWDSGEAGANPACSVPAKAGKAAKQAKQSLRSEPGSVYCIVPAGALRTGGSYVVTTTTVTSGSTRSERRLFSIADIPAASGSNLVAVKSREVSSPLVSGGISLNYSTADQGATADTAAISGFRGGLPAGWSWVGLPNGLSKATLGPANGYEQFTDFLTLDTSGTSTVLGCKDTAIGKQCDPLTGVAAGVGFSATIPTGSSNIVVTRQTDGTNWTFDGRGRLTDYDEPGHAPLKIDYKGDTELMASVRIAGIAWNFFYGSDSECNDSGRAAGFVDVPDDLICVLEQPFDQWTKFDYTQPAGASQARLSRATGAPQSCEFSIGDCDWRELQIFDLGWDANNRPQYLRDPITSQAIMAGSLVAGSDPAADPTLQRTQYDELGRIGVQTLAALTSTGVRQIQTRAYQEFDKVQQAYQPATHQTSTTATLSDNSAKPLTGLQAFDDRMRPLYKQEPDGTLSQTVWHPTKNLQYAGIQAGNVTATEFDKSGIAIASYTGFSSAFDLSQCTQKAPAKTLEQNPCLPKNPDGVVTSKNFYGDAASVGNGMITAWYDGSAFSGSPVSTSARTYDNGFSIDVPQGVDGKNWSVRFSGGLVLRRQEYSIKLAVPDRDIKGTVWIAGNFCSVIDGQVGSCTYDNSSDNKFATGLPIGFGINLSRNSGAAYAGGKLQLTLQPEDGKREPTTNQHFIQRAYTATRTETRDPMPDGKGANTGSVSYFYADPLAGSATKVEGSSLSGDGGGKWQQQASTTQFEPAPFGGARTASVTSATGSKYTYEYWGVDETPADAGLANLGQVPDEVRNTPQFGAVKAITDPSGRVTTQLNDQFGQLACTRFSNTSDVDSGNWSCTSKDQMGRPVKAVTAANDGQPAIETEYAYELVRSPGDRYLTTTTVTKSDGAPDQRITQTISTAQKLIDYQDAIGTRGRFTVNPLGLVTDEEVTAAPVKGKQAAPIRLHTSYDAIGNEVETSIGGQVFSRTNWESTGPGRGQRLASVTYPTFGIELRERYDSASQLLGQTWTLKDGSKVEDDITTTLGETLISTEFAGEKADYDYAGGTVLKRATIAGNDFTYGYDQDGRRICSAAAIANPGNAPKSCQELAGHYEYTYADDRVVASTDPNANVPQDSWDSYGNYRRIGNISLEYDAAAQLTKATTPDGGIMQVQRDLSGRVTQQTMNVADTTLNLTVKQWKQAKELLAKQRKAGTDQGQVLDQFLAGLPRTAVAAGKPAEPVRNAAEAQPSGDSAQPSATATDAKPQGSQGSQRSQSPEATDSSSASPSSGEPSSAEPSLTQTPSVLGSPTESAAAPAPANPQTTTLTTQTLKFGYTSAAGAPRVMYGDEGAAIIHTLSGGLRIQGASITIPSLSGIGSLKIDNDGARGASAPQFTGPYGERIGDTDPALAGMPGSRLGTAGVRTFSRDLGVFAQPDPKIAAGAGQYSYGSGDPVNYSDPSGTSSFKDWIKDTLGIGTGKGMSSFWAAVTSIGMGVLTGVALAGAYRTMLKASYFANNMFASSSVAAGIFGLIGFGMSAATEALVSYGHVNWDSAWTWSFNGICASITGIGGGIGFKVERMITLGRESKLVSGAANLLNQGTQALNDTRAAVAQVRDQIKSDIKSSANSVTTAVREEIVPVIKQGASQAAQAATGATIGWAVGGMVGEAVQNYTGLPIKPVLQVAGSAVGGYLGTKVAPLAGRAVTYLKETRLGKAFRSVWNGANPMMVDGVLQIPTVPARVINFNPQEVAFGDLDRVQFDFDF